MITPKTRKSENAIIVSDNLVQALQTAVAQGATTIQVPCSARESLDMVVQWMINDQYYSGSPNPIVYWSGPRTGQYKWFDSDVARSVQGWDACKDKGRFVDAMVALYLWGQNASQYLVSARRLLPRPIEDAEKAQIAKTLAEMPAAKDRVSKFVPTTFEQLPTDA